MIWLVKIPFQGTATIPIQSDEKPDVWDSEISGNLHAGFFDEGMPIYYRNKAKIEKTDNNTYTLVNDAAKKRFNRKSQIISTVLKEAGFKKEIS